MFPKAFADIAQGQCECENLADTLNRKLRMRIACVYVHTINRCQTNTKQPRINISECRNVGGYFAASKGDLSVTMDAIKQRLPICGQTLQKHRLWCLKRSNVYICQRFHALQILRIETIDGR